MLLSCAGRITGRSIIASISDFVTGPGRNSVIWSSSLQSITVDSRPRSHQPPSRIISILSAIARATCSAQDGLIFPLGLADGATTGKPHADSSLSAMRCAGTRTATEFWPALASVLIWQSVGRSSTSVIGPGQKWLASMRAVGLLSISANTASELA